MSRQISSTLLECGACKAEIAMAAKACPKCGAPNEWKHPSVERVRDLWSRGEVVFPTNDPAKYRLHLESAKINIVYEKPVGIWPYAWRFLAILAGFLFYIIPGVLLGTYFLVKNTEWMDDETKHMSVNFLTGERKFGDEQFWAPLVKSIGV